jgi:hypothetical protein
MAWVTAKFRVSVAASSSLLVGGCAQHRMDCGGDVIGYCLGGGGVELAVEVEERESVDERPCCGCHRFGVGCGEDPPDDLAEVEGYGCGCALVVVSVAGFSRG